MRENWHTFLEATLTREGFYSPKTPRGWVNDPDDSGGPTLAGVTYEEFCLWTRTPYQKKVYEPHVIQRLRSLTDEQIAAYYRERKWDRVDGDRLPPGVDLCVADSATLHGVGQAVLFLQRALGRPDTARLSPDDVNAAVAAPDLDALVVSICDQRRQFYGQLVQRRPKDRKYLGGWRKRTASLEVQCTRLAPDKPAPRPDALGELSTSSTAVIQRRLNSLGFALGTADGNVDTAHRAAVFAFQDQHGLDATGELDADTLATLSAPYAQKLQVPAERSDITADELLARGSQDIAAARSDKKIAGLMIGGGVSAALDQTLDGMGIDAVSSALNKANSLLGQFGLGLASISPAFLVAVGLCAFGYLWWRSAEAREIRRVDKARLGLDLSK